MNKWGQGMKARWFAFIILILLLGWGGYSSYRVMYTYLGWQSEVPDPGIDISQAVECDLPDCTDPNTGKQTIIGANEAYCHVCGSQRNGSGIPWSAFVAVLIFLLFFWIAWRMCHGKRGSTILIETEQELRKVVWPSWARVVNSSIVVVITMVGIAAILFISDILINTLIRNVLNLW